jgi:ABC-type nitrate/sulfonate/bicarbonate transport system substrate-binding protein
MRTSVALLSIVIGASVAFWVPSAPAIAADAAVAKKDVVIRFGNQPGIATASIVKHYGWLEKQGYTVKWINFNDAGSEMRALAAGELDVMLAGAAPEMVLSSKYAGSMFVAGPLTNGNQLIVPVDSPIKTIKDLKGKRIAYPGPGSQQYALIATALHAEGMKPEDVDLYKSVASDMLSLMQRKEIDGFMAWTPFTSEAVRTGAGRVLLSAQDVFAKVGGKGEWISEGYVTSRECATKHPDALVDCMTAVARSARLIRTRQDEAVAALSTETGLAKETIAFAIDKKFAIFPPSIAPDSATVQSMVQIFADSGLIQGVNISDFVHSLNHPEFAQKAEATLDREARK